MKQPPTSIDLHCHSNRSDGSLPPADLVRAAVAAGVEVLALTDHDSVDGLAEATEAAHGTALRLIPGVELSASWQRRTLHIVGLGIDAGHPTLTALLARTRALRESRAAAIAAKLEKLGVKEALVKAQAISNGQITRTHFARLLITEGKCKNMQRAFDRFLGTGKPAYVAVEWASLEESVQTIHAAGGRAVLAHPLRYDLSGAWRDRLLAAFTAAGGDGLEVCCGSSNLDDIQTSLADAVRHKLRGSIGSDFHSPGLSWNQLGRVYPLPTSVQPVWAGL